MLKSRKSQHGLRCVHAAKKFGLAKTVAFMTDIGFEYVIGERSLDNDKMPRIYLAAMVFLSQAVGFQSV
jgi:hypothetical protein